MIYAATRRIDEYFTQRDIKHRVYETQNTSVVEVKVGADNTSITVRLISNDNDNDVSLRIYSLVKAPENKRAVVLETINAQNERFRFVSFSLDSDNEVTVACDIPVRTTDVGPVAEEMYVRIVDIADKAYPELMKAIWA